MRRSSRYLPARADEIGDVPAVLAVDTDRNAGEAGGNRRLERGQVARVDDRRPQRAEQSQQLRIKLERRVRRSCGARGTSRRPARPARGTSVTSVSATTAWRKSRGGHPVDEVHDAVLEAADVEAMDDVGDERTCVLNRRLPLRHGHRPRVASRRASIAGAMSATKAGQRSGGLLVARVAHGRVHDDHCRVVASPGQPVEGGVELGDVVTRRHAPVDPVPLPRLQTHAVGRPAPRVARRPARRRVTVSCLPPAATNHRSS